jgi:hypothetical protein
MDTADWCRDPAEEQFVLRPPDGRAEFQIDTYDYGTSSTWPQLWFNAQRRAPPGTRIEPVSCGQFAGVTFEYTDAEGVYWREWCLSLAEIVLLITYNCPSTHSARDREAVDWMLATLTDGRA